MLNINKFEIICALGCALALAACGKSAAPQAPPPPQVSVAQVLEKRVKDWDEFTGRLQAVETVEIRPRVSGYIDKVAFTEGALISYGRSQSRREALQIAAAASDKAADLARKRFEGGLIDFLEVLDAERTALSAELLLSQSRTDAATSLIAVYKALGAGWRAAEQK